MPFLTTNGLELWFDTAGDEGPPVLLIMGLSVPGSAWRFQVPALAEHHRVGFFDNRGSGQSDAPVGPYTMAQMADDAVAVLDHLGWDKAHVIGVSLGGMVAQEVALRHRDRVLTLALIATHAGGGLLSGNARPTLWGLPPLISAAIRSGEARIDAFERLLFPAHFRETVDRAWLREVLHKDYGSPPPLQGRRGQVRATFSHDTRDRLPQLEGLPTLIVRPGLDILVPPSASDELHALIPGSTLSRFDDAGHGVIRQSRDALNAALLAHLRATHPPAAREPAG